MVVIRPEESGLPQLLERILDKGVAIDAIMRVKILDNDLIGLRSKAFITSFRTASFIGLDLPRGTDQNLPAWMRLTAMHPCPLCGMESDEKTLEHEGCPWCGFIVRKEV